MIQTERLILREWKQEDYKKFAELNSDIEVMKYLGNILSEQESNNLIEKLKKNFLEYGYGLWAAEIKETGEFIGFIGLNHPDFTAHFTPCVEIGWRLAKKYWGRGYAPEGAKMVLEYAFKNLSLEEVVAFTVTDNLNSRRVMEKIGMQQDLQGSFAHPKLAKDHPFSMHVLYRIQAN